MPTPLKSALLALSTAALLAACGSAPTAPPTDLTEQAKPAATRHPILFVHGYNSSGSIWTTMIGNFKRDGWNAGQLFAWTYNTAQSNAATATQLQAKVNEILVQTGASKVDIISHSMGALSSRYYLKNLAGDARVDAWVSLGGPNHGTNVADLCFETSCTEMRVGSTFLASLNSLDETPGLTRYATWRSPCDEVINPDSSVPLAGAVNTQTACLSHSSLYTSSLVYAQVRDFVK